MTEWQNSCVNKKGHTDTYVEILYKWELPVKLWFSQNISAETSCIRNETLCKTFSAITQEPNWEWREGSSTSSARLCLTENGMHQQEPLGNNRTAFVLRHFSWKPLALPLLSCSSSFASYLQSVPLLMVESVQQLTGVFHNVPCCWNHNTILFFSFCPQNSSCCSFLSQRK